MEIPAYLISYGTDWLNLLLRWLHIITGIAWIGASFYFVWLDNSLRPPKPGSELERHKARFVEAWPYSPELLQLLDDEVIFAVQAQGTRDLVRILSR